MRKLPSVTLLIESSNAYGRGLLRGIAAFVHAHGPWSLSYTELRRGEAEAGWAVLDKRDGIIARVESAAMAKALSRRGVPVVNLSPPQLAPHLPFVETDNEAIARVAAEHLFSRGFRQLAYYGLRGRPWSDERRDHFSRLVAEAGGSLDVWEEPSGTLEADGRSQRLLASWLNRLPRPVGIMAAYDECGRRLLDVCVRLGLAVPDEVAVVGVDNDDLLCEMASPSLSSVIPDTHRTGYVGAELLQRLMAGESVSCEGILIPPLGIATRRSSDAFATDDPIVAKAAQFIRDHACEGIQIKDVLRAVPASRRVLEHRFRRALGRTPHAEIVRIRLERVKELLALTDLSLAEIASRTGFNHTEYLSIAFKEKVGQNPSAYRRDAAHRRGAPVR